jgi:diaminopimelate decarboxylase
LERSYATWSGRSANHAISSTLDRSLPAPRPGDLLSVMTAGAYGAVQAGTCNTRPLIPEVLVRTDEWALVRPRLTAEQLIALDRLPPWL